MVLKSITLKYIPASSVKLTISQQTISLKFLTLGAKPSDDKDKKNTDNSVATPVAATLGSVAAFGFVCAIIWRKYVTAGANQVGPKP